MTDDSNDKKKEELERNGVVKCTCGCGEYLYKNSTCECEKCKNEPRRCSCGCGQILKPIKTPYWDIDGDIEEKKEVFGEGRRVDDNRIANAQRALHSRLSESEREKALKWTSFYQFLLQEDS